MGLCRGNTLRGSAAPHAAEVKAGLAKANMVRVIPVCKLIPQSKRGTEAPPCKAGGQGPAKPSGAQNLRLTLHYTAACKRNAVR